MINKLGKGSVNYMIFQIQDVHLGEKYGAMSRTRFSLVDVLWRCLVLCL